MNLPYFDPRPKTRREDLYDREEELRKLASFISSGKPLVAVTGMRRLGKTSLILVALSELRYPYILVDARGLPPNPSYRDLYERIAIALNRFFEMFSGVVDSVRRYLERVKGIEFLGVSISLSWSREKRVDLVQLFDSIDRWARDRGTRVVVVLDEVQRIVGRLGRVIAEVVAHLYDYGEATTVIVSGSEVGVLYRFLGVEDPEHPLYGRHVSEVKLGRFSREQSVDFLIKGFNQFGVDPPRDAIEYAVDRLDGVVGWLVEFGLRCIERGEVSRDSVEIVMEKASALALSELEHLLATRPREARQRYLAVLEAIARGYNTWSSIERYVSQRLGSTIPKSALHNILKNLIEMSVVEKIVEERNVSYRITDPVLEHGLRKSRHAAR